MPALLFSMGLGCAADVTPGDAIGCSFEEPDLPAVARYFPERLDHTQNPTTTAGAALGRRLFYDPGLSSNGRVSCATCHEPAYAFSIPEALTKRGVSGVTLQRHAPVLFNLAWAEDGLFWDGGSKNLESQALAPLLHADEMGRHGLAEVVAALGGDPGYVAQFARAFRDEGLSGATILQALAQFQRTIVSDRSRWDESERGELELEPAEQAGEAVYEAHCARCHTAGLFTDDGFHNTGLDAEFGEDAIDGRRGRARITQQEADLGKFRTPSLRNVAISAPYMHDGRFATLVEVIEHYRAGVKNSATLDSGFVHADGALGITLSDAEAASLLHFLVALTDQGLAERYAPLPLPRCPPEGSP